MTRKDDNQDGLVTAADVVIRRGRLDDIVDLRAIECSVFDFEQLTTRAFRRYLGLAGADLLVATWRETVVGYGLASYRRGSRRGYVSSIAVATRATGRGIGMRLLEALRTEALARGMVALRLEVRRDNLAAQRLYERAGYAVIGERPGYYADFCDAIVMEAPLAE